MMLPVETLPNSASFYRHGQTGRGATKTLIASDVRCSMDAKSRVSASPDGPQLTEWKLLVVRAGAVDAQPQDRVVVNGQEWTVREVTPVAGPNGRVAHLEIVAW